MTFVIHSMETLEQELQEEEEEKKSGGALSAITDAFAAANLDAELKIDDHFRPMDERPSTDERRLRDERRSTDERRQRDERRSADYRLSAEAPRKIGLGRGTCLKGSFRSN